MSQTIDPNLVVVESRIRQHFDRKKLQELTESIRKHGQLQPGVCRKEGDQVVLIIGERRLRSCLALEIPFTFEYKDDVTDEFTLREIELTENLEREDLTFQEVCFAREQLHRLYEEKHNADPKARGGYGIRDTADTLGISKSNLADDIELAQWMREIPDIANAKNKTEAKKQVQRLRDGVLRKQGLQDALKKSREASKAIADESIKAVAKTTGSAENDMVLEWDRRTLLGPFESNAKKFQKGVFSVVFWDPPWGVDFDKVAAENSSTTSYKDERDSFLEAFPDHLQVIYDLMSEDSHLYLVFGIVHHKFIHDSLEAVGFTTNRIPLIWHKKGAHRTRNPNVWPGRCYEPIAYARKGKKRLVMAGRPDIIETPMPTRKLKLSHPSAKHPDLIVELLRRSCEPGDCVLDPMCGSGMFGVACDYLRNDLALDWFQIEQLDEFRTLALHNLQRGYHTIVGDKDENSSGQGYKQLVPGSTEWITYWDDHPEEQDEMMEWLEGLKGGK